MRRSVIITIVRNRCILHGRLAAGFSRVKPFLPQAFGGHNILA
jgi:hypothetical protein